MYQNNPKRIVEPSVEPVTLAEAKEWLRIDGTDEDSKITALVSSARETVERFLNRTLITTTWRYKRDAFPSAGAHRQNVDQGLTDGYKAQYESEAKFYGVQPSDIVLPMGEIQSISSVKYVDRAGSEQTFTDFFLGRDMYATPSQDKFWPSNGDVRDRDGVTIDYIAGYGATASDVPEDIKTAIKMLVQVMYEECDCSMNKAMKAILIQYKNPRMPIARTRTLERG